MILAAGESKRYGKNKLLTVYKNDFLINHVLNLVRKRFDRKVLVLGKYIDDISKNCNLKGFSVIYNDNYKKGLSTSLKIGMENVQTKWAMIFLGDMPEIQDEFIDILLSNRSKEYNAYFLSYNDKKGFPVLVNEAFYAKISSISGDKGLRSVLKTEKRVKKISINDKRCIIDIDREDQNNVG